MKQALDAKMEGIGEAAATTTSSSAPHPPTFVSISDEAERLLPPERRVEHAVGPDLIFGSNPTRLGRKLLHHAVLAGLVEGLKPSTFPRSTHDLSHSTLLANSKVQILPRATP